MKNILFLLILPLSFSFLVSAEIFDWDQNKDYNAGVTVVVKDGDNAGSYRSLQSVSAGTPITSTDYWYNLFLESNLPDYVKAGENPDQEGLTQALEGGTPNIEDIPNVFRAIAFVKSPSPRIGRLKTNGADERL